MARPDPPPGGKTTASLLRGVLAEVAAEQRLETEPLPTAEDLVALHRGSLGAAERETLLDRLSVDPELSSLLLELRDADSLEPERLDATALQLAWRRFRRRLVRERAALLAAVAALLLASTLALFLRRDTAIDPAAGYYPIEVPASPRRDSRTTVPQEAPGVALGLSRELLEAQGVLDPDRPPDQPTEIEARLYDAADQLVYETLLRTRSDEARPDEESLQVAIPARVLEWERTYRLEVVSPRGLFEWVWTPTAER